MSTEKKSLGIGCLLYAIFETSDTGEKEFGYGEDKVIKALEKKSIKKNGLTYPR